MSVVSSEVPTKLSLAIADGEKNSKQVGTLKARSENLKKKVQSFLYKTEPLRNELSSRFTALSKYEVILSYLRTFEKVEDLR